MESFRLTWKYLNDDCEQYEYAGNEQELKEMFDRLVMLNDDLEYAVGDKTEVYTIEGSVPYEETEILYEYYND